MCSVTEIGYQSFRYKCTMVGVGVMTSYKWEVVISGQLHLHSESYQSFVVQLATLTGTSGALAIFIHTDVSIYL